MGDEGPAVIGALFDQVEFVAAARAVLNLIEIAIGRESQALGTADAIGPDLRQRPGLSGERIAGRRRAVLGDADHLAQMGVEILRHRPGTRTRVVAVADGDIEKAILADSDA